MSNPKMSIVKMSNEVLIKSKKTYWIFPNACGGKCREYLPIYSLHAVVRPFQMVVRPWATVSVVVPYAWSEVTIKPCFVKVGSVSLQPTHWASQLLRPFHKTWTKFSGTKAIAALFCIKRLTAIFSLYSSKSLRCCSYFRGKKLLLKLPSYN